MAVEHAIPPKLRDRLTAVLRRPPRPFSDTAAGRKLQSACSLVFGVAGAMVAHLLPWLERAAIFTAVGALTRLLLYLLGQRLGEQRLARYLWRGIRALFVALLAWFAVIGVWWAALDRDPGFTADSIMLLILLVAAWFFLTWWERTSPDPAWWD